MNRFATTAAGGIMVQLSVLMSPSAVADNLSFVGSAKALGFQQASENLISTARSACYFLSVGRDPGQVSDRISRYLSVDADLAQRFFAISVNEYCPQYLDRVGA